MATRQSSRTLLVKVQMPPEESLEVQLVPASVIDTLERLKANESLAHLILSVCVGGVFEIILSIATGTLALGSYSSIGLLSILALGFVVGMLWLIRIRAKVQLYKKRYKIG